MRAINKSDENSEGNRPMTKTPVTHRFRLWMSMPIINGAHRLLLINAQNTGRQYGKGYARGKPRNRIRRACISIYGRTLQPKLVFGQAYDLEQRLLRQCRRYINGRRNETDKISAPRRIHIIYLLILGSRNHLQDQSSRKITITNNQPKRKQDEILL